MVLLLMLFDFWNPLKNDKLNLHCVHLKGKVKARENNGVLAGVPLACEQAQAGRRAC